MSALLTSVLDSSTKVAEYIGECRELGIRVLPPDVNESGADFTVAGGQHPASASRPSRTSGAKFIALLVAEREQNGPFRGLEEFCRRMSGKELNRRAVESLIKSGAMDSLGLKRRAMLQMLDLILESIAADGPRQHRRAIRPLRL